MAAQEIPLAGFRTKLLSRSSVAEGTMVFHFAKPSGFSFKAGQAADLTLLNPPETDSEGNIRTFSIASPPFEDQLTFATRMRDTAFKRSLKTAPIGTEINIASASGSFTLHKNANKQAVFLAGRNWDYAVLEHRSPGRSRSTGAQAVLVLFQSATGRRSLSRYSPRPGKDKSEFSAHRHHDRNGSLRSRMER